MPKPKSAPYGSGYRIQAEDIVRDSIRLRQLMLDNGDLYWSELRPSEGGRNTIMCRKGGGRRWKSCPRVQCQDKGSRIWRRRVLRCCGGVVLQ